MPGGDRHLGGEPGRYQVRQQRGLLVLQRRHRHIAADQHLGRVDRVVAAVQHIRHGHGEVADQRRVGHVAEVHDPADPQIVVEQHVVQAHVAVDHLGAQGRQHRLDAGHEAVQHPLHLSPALGVGDVTDQQPELGRVGEVPQDLVVGRGMEKPPQRPPQPGRGLPDGPDRLRGERGVRGHPPGQEREQPHREVPAVGPAHLGPGLPHRVRQDPHHRQARVHPLDVAQRGGLHLHGGQAVRRVGDLEQEAPPVGGIHPEVLVTFARERGEGRGFHAEAVPEDPLDGLGVEGGRRARERVKTLGHRAEAILRPGEWATARPRASGPAIHARLGSDNAHASGVRSVRPGRRGHRGGQSRRHRLRLAPGCSRSSAPP